MSQPAIVSTTVSSAPHTQVGPPTGAAATETVNDVHKLRTSVKNWERNFEATHGRKPTSKDAKADREAYALYHKYRSVKKAVVESTHMAAKPHSSGFSTPRKAKSKTSYASGEKNEANGDSATDDDNVNGEDGAEEQDDDVEETPSKSTLKEIFPTPQFRGRVLGLFDVELGSPRTPTKQGSNRLPSVQQEDPSFDSSDPSLLLLGQDSSSVSLFSADLPSSPRVPRSPMSPQSTPIHQSVLLETPLSKKTPDYFLHRVNLFPPPLEASGESPLIKTRPVRGKSVSDIIREAPSLDINQPELLFAQDLRRDDTNTRLEPSGDTGTGPDSAEPNTHDTDVTEVPAPNLSEWRRSKPKRQTKRVVMRPIGPNTTVSTAKATDNFVRLKINHNKKKPFRRR